MFSVFLPDISLNVAHDSECHKRNPLKNGKTCCYIDEAWVYLNDCNKRYIYYHQRGGKILKHGRGS
jgi:hypothetical protein